MKERLSPRTIERICDSAHLPVIMPSVRAPSKIPAAYASWLLTTARAIRVLLLAAIVGFCLLLLAVRFVAFSRLENNRDGLGRMDPPRRAQGCAHSRARRRCAGNGPARPAPDRRLDVGGFFRPAVQGTDHRSAGVVG